MAETQALSESVLFGDHIILEICYGLVERRERRFQGLIFFVTRVSQATGMKPTVDFHCRVSNSVESWARIAKIQICQYPRCVQGIAEIRSLFSELVLVGEWCLTVFHFWRGGIAVYAV